MRLNQEGQILPVVLIIVGLVLLSTLMIVAGARLFYQNSGYSTDSEKATQLAEAGIDKAVASLNKTGGTYNGETATALGDGQFTVAMASNQDGTKAIVSTGYIPNASKPRAKRTIKIQASQGTGVAFVYGVQIGAGGFELGNGNTLKGTVYSNGNVIGGNSNTITGDAWVAGGAQPNPDQIADCVGPNCQPYDFGKLINGETRFDVAQSFKISGLESQILNKVQIRIKKTGNPSDIAVRIVGDTAGQNRPDKNNVLVSGTLYSSLVSTTSTQPFGWVEITFNALPTLSPNTTYWLVLDTSGDNSNYWSWQQDSLGGYTNGSPKYSPDWSSGQQIWNSIPGDLSIQTYLGGTVNVLRGGNGFIVQGDAHSHTIDTITVNRDAYYKSLVNSTVGRNSFPGSDDPAPKVFPISESNISDWKQEAENNGIRNSSITTCQDIPSSKIIGNITIGSGCNAKISTPVWVTGNFTLGSNNTFTLNSTHGTKSGVIIVGDAGQGGVINFNSNNHLNGTGQGSSILMALSTFDSRVNNLAAVSFNSNGNAGVFYTNNGIIEPGNNNDFKQLTAYKIRIVNNSTISYETGLASTLFSAGPSGKYSLVKGTYQSQ